MEFPPVQPATIVVLGAGRFGRLAARRLPARYRKASIVLVDRDASRLQGLDAPSPVEKVQDDALTFLDTLERPNLWIVPAVPIHVAWQWVLSRLQKMGAAHPLPVPAEMDRRVPNPLRVDGETLYASFAHFKCPDNCPEPDKICTFTGKPRPGILHRHLARVSVPGHCIHVLRSWQLAPGVGGYTLGHLHDILRAVEAVRGRHILATSCSCHAVLNGLAWHGKDFRAHASPSLGAMEDSSASK